MQSLYVVFWLFLNMGLSACSQSHTSTEKQTTTKEASEHQTPLVNLEAFQDSSTHLYGYRNPQSEEVVIQPQYAAAKPFSHQLAAVCLADTLDGLIAKRWGYLNPMGDTQIPFIFIEAGSFGDTIQVSERIRVVAAPVKFLPQVHITSFQPDQNPYYVDVLGNCIPAKESKLQEKYHAQELKPALERPVMTIFFEKEGSVALNQAAIQRLESFLIHGLIGGHIQEILSGKSQFHLEGHNSSGQADQNLGGPRMNAIAKYLKKHYPSLKNDDFFTYKDEGVGETTFVHEGDRHVFLAIRKKNQ
jgi:hypothetical protein